MAIPTTLTAPIRTARLDLAPLRVEDAREMVAVLADPALYGFIGGTPPSLAELARRYRAQVRGRSGDGREEWHNWIVRERSSNTAIGFVQATIVGRGDPADGGGRRSDGAARERRAGPAEWGEGDERVPEAEVAEAEVSEAEVAWLIGTAWQRRGYASEAAAGLVGWLRGTGIETIVAHVHPDHVGSATVAGRIGLVPTDVFLDGERAWRRRG